ncbi:hypothetical protein C2S53_018117 [Perilla frutescens var. hirtella]|uniref:NB-ARC domain-containing protein n=1 Tax=Perilla frutescens var. hirtella TaxID=608512 RepID=A0AAD4IR13_PERFH|nr:hypothetical protein C2S53_018117 [Perilla frutescens var. hirtella]
MTLAADASEEVIESHAVDQIRAGKSRSRFLPDLQKLIEGVDFVRSEFKLKQPPTLYSSTPLTSEKKISMVGFDEVLVQRLDLLTREHSRRSVIHIVGMGGIGKTTLGIDDMWSVEAWDEIMFFFLILAMEVELLWLIGNWIVGELGVFGRRFLILLDDMWSVEACITFLSSLKRLSLSNSRLHWEEMTMMVGSSPHLKSFELSENSALGSEWTLVERRCSVSFLISALRVEEEQGNEMRGELQQEGPRRGSKKQ